MVLKNKYVVFLFGLGLSIWGVSFLFWKVSLEENQGQKNSYYIPIGIAGFTPYGLPYLYVKVEEKVFPMLLDIGFTGMLSIPQDIGKIIDHKTHLYHGEVYGVDGMPRPVEIHSIPQANLGDVVFQSPTLQESLDSSEEEPFSERDASKVGLKLFCQRNLFLDLGRSLIVITDSIETLKKHRYADVDFVRTPLLFDRQWAEIQVGSSLGSLRCLLDTGTTYNCINSETALAQENSLMIEGVELGPVTFTPVSIKGPRHITAILGMEFFREHLVFLDFVEKAAYFAKRPAPFQISECAVDKKEGYYASIPVAEFNPQGLPLLTMKIDNKTLPMILDIGHQEDLILPDLVLNEIREKTYLYDVLCYNMFGKEFRSQVYDVSDVGLGPIRWRFSQSCAREEWVNAEREIGAETGVVGYSFFLKSNLLLDIPNSTIAIADSLDTLRQHGYQGFDFIQAPLLMDRGLLEIQVQGGKEPLRCVLSMGDPCNLINVSCETEQHIESSSEEVMIKIEETNFGSMRFVQSNLKFPFHIDAVLGMDFLKKFPIFFDFANRFVYFARKTDSYFQENDQ